MKSFSLKDVLLLMQNLCMVSDRKKYFLQCRILSVTISLFFFPRIAVFGSLSCASWQEVDK